MSTACCGLSAESDRRQQAEQWSLCLLLSREAAAENVLMPNVMRIGPYRFHFWSRENNEPPHVHVTRDRREAKFWLDPLVEVARNWGFAAHELNRLRDLVEANRERLLEAWHEHFGAN
jgi:hypothetical protein